MYILKLLLMFITNSTNIQEHSLWVEHRRWDREQEGVLLSANIHCSGYHQLDHRSPQGFCPAGIIIPMGGLRAKGGLSGAN